jgi:hypothetical protein
MAMAYDSANHDILLDKLYYYGIHGSALLGFRSYLENRRQRVEILHKEFGKTSSGWKTIKNGVPQGWAPFLAHCYFYCTSLTYQSLVLIFRKFNLNL